MYLKSLTLKGFKSFAETTTLRFEPGVTAVVGPNGSGKSNVVDAIAWVLGAQGAKALRGGRMDDVIFAGTGSKAALGRAEVTLTIDNSSGRLPVELSEISIRRTLFRDGDSEYALNGTSCRLLDIQELLSDAGVGRTQHVIVGQGQLDAVLEARPEERRAAIEEAAGILKFRKRREKTQRRLQSTDADFVRLGDLLREVRRQMRPLERQAQASRSHQGIVEELERLRLYLAGENLARLRQASRVAAEALEGARARQAQVAAGLDQLDAAVSEAELEVANGWSSSQSDDLRRCESAASKAAGLIAVLEERHKSLLRTSAATLDEGLLDALGQERDRTAAELEAVEADAAELIPQSEAITATESEIAAATSELHEQFDLAKEEEKQALSSLVASECEVTNAELSEQSQGEIQVGASLKEQAALAAGLRMGVDRDTSELQRLQRQRVVIDQALGSLDERHKACEASMSELSELTDDLMSKAEAAALDVQRAEEDAISKRDEFVNASASLQSWQAKVEALGLALQEVRHRSGAQMLEGSAGVAGSLPELVNIEQGWEKAFVAALGQAFAGVVVPECQQARDILAILRGQDQTATVLCARPDLDSRAAKGGESLDSGQLIALRSLVSGRLGEVNAILDRLLEGVFGIIGNWELAVQLQMANPGSVVVTQNGDRFSDLGWSVGTDSPGVTAALLAEAELKVAQARDLAADASVSSEGANSCLSQAKDLFGQLQLQKETLQRRLRAAAAELAAISREGEIKRDERAGVEQRCEATELRLNAGLHKLVVTEAIVASLEAFEQKQEQLLESFAARRMELNRQKSDIDAKAAAVDSLRHDLQVRAVAMQERRRLLAERLKDLEERLRSMDLECRALEIRRLEAGRLLHAGNHLLSAARRCLTRSEAAKARVQTAAQELQNRFRQAQTHLSKLRKERSEAESKLAQLRESVSQAQVRLSETEMHLQAASDAIRRDFNCEPAHAEQSQLGELPPATSPQSRVVELERELRLLGPVNPLALEELSALQERSSFLAGQLEDIRNARRELSKVISAIDAEIISVFESAWSDVCTNFTELIGTVFPGGAGSLSLVDPTSLLESGVEIEARPAGKQVRKLSLLSGGERSLVALAFLFALFRSRPSPFYLMDEVEAALDDVNLTRFLDLVNELRGESQLLLVTHQKRTMQDADCLYGVTMRPGGSSKVLTERVEEILSTR